MSGPTFEDDARGIEMMRRVAKTFGLVLVDVKSIERTIDALRRVDNADELAQREGLDWVLSNSLANEISAVLAELKALVGK